MKRITRKTVKVCMSPDDYIHDFLHGAASEEEKIRRLKDYVKCVNKVEREHKKLKT